MQLCLCKKRHLILGLRYTQVLFKWFSSVSHFIEYNNQTRRSKGYVPKIHLSILLKKDPILKILDFALDFSLYLHLMSFLFHS